MKKIYVTVAVLFIGLVSCEKRQENIIALRECPQKMEGLSVELSQNEEFVQTIKIMKDGRLLQELIGDGNDAFFRGWTSEFTNSMVYYVDANFDGYTDIYIGDGGDRSYNTILIWDSDKNLFERYGKLGEPTMMNPYFSPSENAIYESGSGGLYNFWYSKSVWKDGKLVEQEILDEILFREGFDFDSYNEFKEYKISKKYTLFDSNNKLIVETNEIDGLPTKWVELVTKEKALWGDNSDDFPTYEKLKEYETNNLEENIKEQIVKLINDNNGWEVLSSPSSVLNLQKVSEGMYRAEFIQETQYEYMDYEIFNIEVGDNGNVNGLETKRVNIRPKANKPDGTMRVDEMVDRMTGRNRR